MRVIIIDLQKSDSWKIKLTVAINFISSMILRKHLMHSKSYSIKFTSYDANKVVNSDSLPSRYADNLEISMRGSEFIFDSV